jgi:hypothetical protein
MVSVSVDEALTRVRDEKRRLRKEEKETMDFVEEEEMREEVRVWSESEESDERADAVAIEMEELFWMRKEVRMKQNQEIKNINPVAQTRCPNKNIHAQTDKLFIPNGLSIDKL